jgi:CubicO group peptidase (beta-lactamase class C family)
VHYRLVVSLIDNAVGVASRRCWVPSDLSSVTSFGSEVGSDVGAEQIWTHVESLYRSGMHPGIQVCIRHHGDVVVNRAIGYARGNLPGRWVDRDSAPAMTVDTPVNLFSAAKAVSAMVMHKLEELGAFGLDDPVADHVPGFERHGKGDITIRHLLTHRAGIAAWPAEAFDLDLLADHDRIVDVICDLRPSAGPGGASAYHAVSGGFVMEAVARNTAGRSMRDVLAEEIKQPLGLDWLDFGVTPDDAASVAHNVETGFLPGPVVDLFIKRVLGKPWGRILRMSNDTRFLTSVIPSGNVIVTASDIAAFYQCLLDGGALDGTRVFDEDTVARAVSSDRDGLEIDRMLAIPIRYSSGFMLGSETVSLYGWNHPRAFGHLGMSNLFTWADPDRALVVAILTTGKPVLGPHLPALVQLITGIHEVFPELREMQ